MKTTVRLLFVCMLCLGVTPVLVGAGGGAPAEDSMETWGGYNRDSERFPRPLETYEDAEMEGVLEVLKHRVQAEPFNAVATLIFFCAIVHTFMASRFLKLAHHYEYEHRQRLLNEGKISSLQAASDEHGEVSFKAQICHFFGEVEAIFGIWLIPLFAAITFFYDWDSVTYFVDYEVHFTEPLFVVVIMIIAATRPILKFAELVLAKVAGIGGGTPAAWWMAIMIIAPLLGSFITEPAAMTIAALLLGHHFYKLKPSERFSYGTLGLLFVSVSVGGTLTHFAAPPVLMVATKWNWDVSFMIANFGWKAIIGILVSTVGYFLFFRKEFDKLNVEAERQKNQHDLYEALHIDNPKEDEPVPFWIMGVHILFLAWTVWNLHHPPLFVAGFLYFIAFAAATQHHQDEFNIKGPILVGFFLAGLVVHGILQQWWIAPVLGSLGELPLFIGATVLTAFNDNAAITFLASQVPQFDATHAADPAYARLLQYAVVAGAVCGGGLTVIANAPNPAGQTLLGKYFPDGVSPLKLLLGALIPTLIMGICFWFFRPDFTNTEIVDNAPAASHSEVTHEPEKSPSH